MLCAPTVAIKDTQRKSVSRSLGIRKIFIPNKKGNHELELLMIIRQLFPMSLVMIRLCMSFIQKENKNHET